MADSGTTFLIDMSAKLTGGDASVATLAKLDAGMVKVGATASDLERPYKQAEIAADKAAKAVERLNASGRSGEAFNKRLAEAVARADAATVALKKEAVALDAIRGKAQGSGDAVAGGSGKVNEMAEAFGKLGGPAGVAGQRIFGLATGFKKLSTSIGAAGPYIAIAVAIVAVATAAIVATVAITKWAVGLADANRTQGLLAAGIAQSVTGGAELDATISKLGDVVPQTREELLAMAGDLAKSGLKGKALTDALEVAAVKAAKLKWGPDFAKQMLALDVQSKRLGTNLAGTFGGLKIEKLLGGFSSLVALFDSSTESGKALKFLFEALFQPVVDGVSKAIPSVERLFLYAEILALKAYIALKPYSGAIKALAEGFLIAAAIVVGVLGVAIAVVFGSIAIMILGPIVLLGLLVAAVVWVSKAIYENFGAAVAFVSDLGGKMIEGLVNGITAGATAVANAITGVVSGAVKAAEHLLGIGSPSKVFAGIGDFTAQGFAQGVEGGASDAQSAMESMVAPPNAKAGAGSSGSQLGSVTVNITVDGKGQSDEGLAAKIAAAVRDVFESDALMLGGGEVPA